MLKGNRVITSLIGLILAVLIIAYAASKSFNLVEGPQLSVDSPKNGETTHSPILTISGSAGNISFLTLNDRQIYVDDTGKFFDQLLLYKGYNIITLKAKDKFGREKKVVREIIYSPVETIEQRETGTTSKIISE